MSDAVVVDTNVAVVANLQHEKAGPDCILASIGALSRARGQVVLVDDGQFVFNEYRGQLSHSGQPGLGDAFFKWLWDNQANPERCRQISITPLDDSGTEFAEFPNDNDLLKFDRADRKFVAVALASGIKPTVLNSSDTDWWLFREALERNGLVLEFLCPELMR